jgi:secreted Zn-dependent insulinase-like peptidase
VLPAPLPPSQNVHEISITFPMPSLFKLYRKKAEHYISHLVGHEGPGSLLSELKRRNWATDLCAGIDPDGHSQNTACHLFGISATLTEAGLAAGPGLGLAVVDLMFEYLAMLEATGPQEWVFQELKSIANMKFQFQEEGDAMDCVTQLAQSMHMCAPEHILVQEYLHEEWDPAQVSGDGSCAVLRCAAFPQPRHQLNLCCAVLRCAALRCAALCCAVLRCDGLCCAVLCCAVL